jgi:hypothetical protein
MVPAFAKDKPLPEQAKPAVANLPKLDFTVELRHVDDGQTSGYTAGTQHQATPWPAQAVRVRNGERASLRIGQSIPVQWVQSVSAQSSSVAAPGVNMRTAGGGVSQATTWINSGQSIAVTPKWAGGKEDVTLEVDLQTSTVGDQAASGLPRQSQNQLATTVTAPLGIWVIIASSGGAVASKGSYGSETGNEIRRTIQLRVTAQ